VKEEGQRRFSDRTVNRIMAHLKTFARWVHKLRPFPLGNPMEKIRLLPMGSGLEVERAITPAERRKILDAADLLVEIGGRSKSRSRYRKGERPKRKGYRPYRNRAIVYALIEAGMRRQAITKLNVEDVDGKMGTVTAKEKGGVTHSYHISTEGLEAIQDYLRQERSGTRSAGQPGWKEKRRTVPVMPWESTSLKRPATLLPCSDRWDTGTRPTPCSMQGLRRKSYGVR